MKNIFQILIDNLKAFFYLEKLPSLTFPSMIEGGL